MAHAEVSRLKAIVGKTVYLERSEGTWDRFDERRNTQKQQSKAKALRRKAVDEGFKEAA